MDFVATLDFWAPETRLYRHTSGQCVAVTCQPMGPIVPSFMSAMMGRVPIDSAHIVAHRTKVFLCDEQGLAIDADGDPANGLTPLLVCDVGTSFEEACAAAEPLLAQEGTHNG